MTQRKPPVRFHFLESFSLKNRRMLQESLRNIFVKEKKRLDSLDYIFCSDDYLLTINQDFLHHDTYTDIITFDLSVSASDPTKGEIYISIDRIRENAHLHQQPFIRELQRVMIHGALHLCGYKDKKKEEKKIMREKEDLYLAII